MFILLSLFALIGLVAVALHSRAGDPRPADASYRSLPTLPFSAVKSADEAQQPAVMQRQTALLLTGAASLATGPKETGTRR